MNAPSRRRVEHTVKQQHSRSVSLRWRQRSDAGMPPRGWAAAWNEFTVHGGAVTPNR